jgi:hypothetical protein
MQSITLSQGFSLSDGLVKAIAVIPSLVKQALAKQ